MSVVLSFLGGLLGKLVAPFLAYMKGRADVKNEVLERQAEKAMEEAKRHANTPVTPKSAAALLRERAKRKRNGKSSNDR